MVNKVLNVGGGFSREVPVFYKGWKQDLLDIDPNVQPDIVADAKEMVKLRKEQYESVYCSHTLEHFYKHEVPQVLEGFKHVLKPNGFAYITVPDVQALVESLTIGNKDIGDMWYKASNVPITFHDVLYGWDRMMNQGNLYYSHKCGFTEKSLTKVLRSIGFYKIFVARDGYNLHAFAFKGIPSKAQLKALGV